MLVARAHCVVAKGKTAGCGLLAVARRPQLFLGNLLMRVVTQCVCVCVCVYLSGLESTLQRVSGR